MGQHTATVFFQIEHVKKEYLKYGVIFFLCGGTKTTKTTKIGKKHLNRQIKLKNNFKRVVKKTLTL